VIPLEGAGEYVLYPASSPYHFRIPSDLIG